MDKSIDLDRYTNCKYAQYLLYSQRNINIQAFKFSSDNHENYLVHTVVFLFYFEYLVFIILMLILIPSIHKP